MKNVWWSSKCSKVNDFELWKLCSIDVAMWVNFIIKNNVSSFFLYIFLLGHSCMLYLKPLASVVELHIATPWGSRRGQGGRLLLKLPLDLWSNTCARGYCICFLSHYFNPLWNGNSHSKSTINNDSHLLQPLWIPQILCEMEILIQSLLLTMILTYFNHLEFNNISEFWNAHNKHVIWNLNMENHMINSGKKTAHKQNSLIISSMEIKKLKSPSSIL